VGLKHKKYVYVQRNDGWFVKVRVLNIRFGTKIEQGDINDPSRYVVVGPKVRKPPLTATIISEEALPEATRKVLYSV